MNQHILDNSDYQQLIHEFADSRLDWDQLKNSQIFITGASGMIGSFIVDMLMDRNIRYKSDIHIIASARNQSRAEERFRPYLKHPSFEFLKYDVSEPLLLNRSFDFIIHAASNTHPVSYAEDAIGTIITNLVGTKNLLDFAIRHPIKRFCFISTVEIYGENTGSLDKFTEKDLGYIDCNTLRAGYPESKRCSEALCNAYNQSFGIDFVIPRLCRVYGPTLLSSDSKALSQFLKNAVNKEDIVLKSEGKQHFSYLHVADAASGILTVLLRGESKKAYNIADEESDITLRDLAQELAKIAGTQVVFQLPDDKEKKGFSTATKALLDASELKKLGWEAKFDIRRGLANTIRILGKDCENI
ncbi:MAG: NAD-dependent epimerase/dehydratase family protein [Erysipelotrichaceae bacterium]